MKSDIMQLIDNYLGRALCFFFSFFKGKRRKRPENLRNVLVIKMFGMGSIVLMTPLITFLREHFRDCTIHFLTFSSNSEIVEIYDMADEVYVVNKKSPLSLAGDIFRVYSAIVRKKFDAIVDAEFFSRMTAVFSFFCCARYNVGFYNYGIYRGDFLDRRCYFNPYRHITESFLELGRALCDSAAKPMVGEPVLEPSRQEAAHEKLKSLGLPSSGERIIVLNPNISDLSPWIDRRWPLERFAAVGKFLRGRGYRIVVIGGPSDEKAAEAVAASMGPPVLSVAGKLSLSELIVLFQRSFLLITNDSGPLHIAASVNLPTFSFFGTDTPVIYGYSSSLHSVFYRGLPCSPCLSVFNFKRGRCDLNIECIKGITQEEVMEEFVKKEAFLSEVYQRNENSKGIAEPEPEKTEKT